MQRLLASYRAIPAGSQVRLAKPTTNLFRPRSAAGGSGLDVSGLTGVVAVDPQARTADVQGMCTYEDLVDATLPHGLMPFVVPQLRTITLGGAVSGLGIESTSWRNGLPHESLLEMDVLTGAGEVVTTSPTRHPDLFRGFPNSYGSLGYATRLRIELEPVSPYVALRHLRFGSAAQLCDAVASIIADGAYEGRPVQFLDGVLFSPDELYLSLGSWEQTMDQRPSDYTGQQIFYRSIREREHDLLTVYDYLWRWDTDWFWCSRALGAQHPLLRRVWPSSLRRSDVYHRMIRFEDRYHVAARLDRLRGRPDRERVVQDVEIPLAATPQFLTWFCDNVPMRPVWLCPLRLRDDRSWPLYPLDPGETYVNVGFWGTVPIGPGAQDGDTNRAVEQAVRDAGGHKSLYSDAYYSRAEFHDLYGGDELAHLKRRYDPDGRLAGLYHKVVERA